MTHIVNACFREFPYKHQQAVAQVVLHRVIRRGIRYICVGSINAFINSPVPKDIFNSIFE